MKIHHFPEVFVRTSLCLFFLVIVMPAIFFVSGCTGNQEKGSNNYLLKIGDQTITRTDYEEALEIAKTAYPYEALRDAETIQGIKTRLLKQLMEELIITTRAQETGLIVSAAELDAAITAIKADYPEGAFEETLFENAVSFAVWKKRLAARLLVEKVIRKELMEKVEVTPAAVRAYYEENQNDASDLNPLDSRNNVMVVKRLRRAEARKQYPEWIRQLQSEYRVELNTQMWERLLQAE